MDNKKLESLRTVGIIEGISFILLMGVAMPMKYMYDMPKAVTIVGGIHGALFLWFMFVLLQVHLDRKWSLVKSLVIFIAAVVPFGPFIADRWLKQELLESSEELAADSTD